MSSVTCIFVHVCRYIEQFGPCHIPPKNGERSGISLWMFRMTSRLCALTPLRSSAVGHHQVTCAPFSQKNRLHKGNVNRGGYMGLHTCNEMGVLLFRFLEDVVELLSLLNGVSECSEICV